MFQKLDMAALSLLDGGRLAKAFEKALYELQEDCKDRPALSSARKLTLTVLIEPECNDDATDLIGCDVGFEIKTAMPKKQTRAYNMRAKGGSLYFNEESPENANQGALGLSGKAANDAQ